MKTLILSLIFIVLGCGALPSTGFAGQVKKIAEGKVLVMRTSWYGKQGQGSRDLKGAPKQARSLNKLTASGKPFRADDLTAAHPWWPFGTILLVMNPHNAIGIFVQVNDRGPFIDGRDLDITRGAAEELDIIKRGVADLIVKVVYLPEPKESS